MNEREQPPLFDWPSTAVRAAPKLATKPGKPTYGKCTPRVRTMCDECCSDICRLGQDKAPFPKVVRWRRRDASGAEMLLCEQHKQVWMERDV